ncbi:caspase family protein [Dechloromonas sp. ZY10]|uniref:caspase family protein n=1 Tax=Dechloromonas aquae TaxID=2664436 RepID=UPI003528382F
MPPLRRLLGFLLFLLTLAGPSLHAAEGARIALVIGNSAYRSGALANPKNDAVAIAEAMRRQGFTVHLHTDASKAEIDRLLRQLSSQSDQAAVVALFYAGHGVQVNGFNYLVPVDASPQNERDLKRDLVKLDDIIDDMGNARVKLVFFDACRDNPLARSFSRGASRGLAAPVEASGTLISFATKHGNVALDGEGRHSPYTEALLHEIREADGIEIEQLLRRIQQRVKKSTQGQQEPWRYGSLDGDFFLRPSRPAPASASRPSGYAQPVDPTAIDLSFWDSIKNSPQATDYELYLEQFPEGRFAKLAQARLRQYRGVAATPQPLPPLQQAAPAQHPTQPARPAVGARWEYEIFDLYRNAAIGKYETTVSAVLADEIDETLSSNGQKIAQRRVSGQTANSIHVFRSPSTPEVLISELNPFLGNSNELRTGQLHSGDFSFAGTQCTGSAKIGERETIKVPAGSFLATPVRVDCSYKGVGSSAVSAGATYSMRLLLTAWYAPEVGRVVRIDKEIPKVFNSGGDRESYRLLSYQISPETSR